MKTINLLFRVLFFIPTLSVMASCNDDKNDNPENPDINTIEVRYPQAQEIDGKAVITWIDPYSAGVKEIKVKDLQSNQEVSVAKGIQKAELDIATPGQTSYGYELKVVTTDDVISNGKSIRLIKNWAQHLHPVLDYKTNTPPQSGMFFKNKPVDKVNVFDIREDEKITKMISAVMQGVLNQEYAQVFLIWEEQYFTQLKEMGGSYEVIPGASIARNKGFSALYNMYKDNFDKLIIWDENIDWTWSIAQMIAAQQKGIPVTEDVKNFIVNELGGWQKEIVDIRNNWSARAEAYDWALENLAGNCHPMHSFSGGLRSDYKDNPWKIYDFAAACKGFVFWLNESDEYDKAIMTKIFTTMKYPVGSSVFGYGMNANGDDLNKLTNTFNAGFVVSDYYANGSYWCSFPNMAFQQRKGIAGEVEPGKIYVAFSLSDGDNVQFDLNSLYRVFTEAKRRDEVPVGVTLAAGLQELNPRLLEFYYKNITENDELTAGPSGIQFIYGDQYNESGKYGDWLDMNNKWLASAGFHTAHLWNTNDQSLFRKYMESSGLDLVLDGSDRTGGVSAEDKLVNGCVRINQGKHCWEEGDVYRDLMSVSPHPDRPKFRHVYLLTDYYGFEGGGNGKVVVYERLIKELEKVERDYPNRFVYMLPMDLAATVKKYMEEGGIY